MQVGNLAIFHWLTFHRPLHPPQPFQLTIPHADEKEAFYRSMLKDVLYESDNIYEIPNLLLEMQAGKDSCK